MTWAKFGKLCRRWLPHAKIIHPYPEERRFARHYPRQEPYAVILHVRNCAGAVSNDRSLSDCPVPRRSVSSRLMVERNIGKSIAHHWLLRRHRFNCVGALVRFIQQRIDQSVTARECPPIGYDRRIAFRDRVCWTWGILHSQFSQLFRLLIAL
jgi:hypothetical protein